MILHKFTYLPKLIMQSQKWTYTDLFKGSLIQPFLVLKMEITPEALASFQKKKKVTACMLNQVA